MGNPVKPSFITKTIEFPDGEREVHFYPARVESLWKADALRQPVSELLMIFVAYIQNEGQLGAKAASSDAGDSQVFLFEQMRHSLQEALRIFMSPSHLQATIEVLLESLRTDTDPFNPRLRFEDVKKMEIGVLCEFCDGWWQANKENWGPFGRLVKPRLQPTTTPSPQPETAPDTATLTSA